VLRIAQTEAEAGTIRNLQRRNAKMRGKATAAAWETFKSKTAGLDRSHPHYQMAERERERTIQQIKRQYPL